MRTVVWNCRRAPARHRLWAQLQVLSPDLALLQEVGGLPEELLEEYQVALEVPPTRHGHPQRFRTALLVRGTLGRRIRLRAGPRWIDAQLRHFAPNLVAHEVEVPGAGAFIAVSVYAPAWPLPRSAYAGRDVEGVKLPENPEIWVSDLVVPALRRALPASEHAWLVGGDFNACETFDRWKSGPRGNARWLARMAGLPLHECLRGAAGRLVPTYRKPGAPGASSQMDHLFVSPSLAGRLQACDTGPGTRVFEDNLSDHLPIVADFGRA